MKHTKHQTIRQTLTDLYRAIDRQHAVTITYVGADGTETVRTVEGHELRTTTDGDFTLVAMCRYRRDERNFLISKITAYTIHRIGYVLERPAPTTYERPAPAPADDVQALFFYELARDKDDADYRPRVRLAAADTALAA